MVYNVKTLCAFGVINTRNIDQLAELALAVVSQECENFDDTVGPGCDGKLTMADHLFNNFVVQGVTDCLAQFN
jgi:hypothetical protein